VTSAAPEKNRPWSTNTLPVPISAPTATSGAAQRARLTAMTLPARRALGRSVEGVIGDDGRRPLLAAAMAATAAGDRVGQEAIQRPAGRCGGHHDDGKGNAEYRQREKRDDRDGDQRRVGHSTLADPDDRLGDDRQHRGRDAGEERRDRRGLAEGDVDRRQAKEGHDAGNDEQDPGDQAATKAVEQPADVDGELLCLGAGQQHAVVQGVQESLLADPALLVDEHPLHDGDLSGRPAEGLQRDGKPRPHRFAERHEIARGWTGIHRAGIAGCAQVFCRH
jgi:hypothetical protein